MTISRAREPVTAMEQIGTWARTTAPGGTETFRPLLFPSPNRSTSRLTTHSRRIISRIESDCELDTPRSRLTILEVREVMA
jgi:hypothetical protein